MDKPPPSLPSFWVLIATLSVSALTIGLSLGVITLAPRIKAAHRSEAETKAEYRGLVAKCHVYVDGSAKCPPGTFRVKVKREK